jgi:hypothetical protein
MRGDEFTLALTTRSFCVRSIDQFDERHGIDP